LPDYKISLVKIPRERYIALVDCDIFANDIDYDMRTGNMKAILVEYPIEYYAMPRYVTTRELQRIFRESDHSYDGFKRSLIDNIEI
jgi:hypothetical protein